MNFEKIPPVPRGKELLDMAFRRARERNAEKGHGDKLKLLRQKEASKLDIVKESLDHNLQRVVQSFPSFDRLPSFYLRLVQLTLDYPALKKSLAAVQWAIQKNRALQKDYSRLVAKEWDLNRLKTRLTEFYGRVSSVIKQVDKNLAYLEDCRKIMKSYPDIKDMFTVCIYGFPNVGKTTLLNALTGSRAKVAAYAFTTKGINSGFMNVDGMTVQVLDVPGTLARPDKMNNIELHAELVVEEVANLIVYVFDISEYCGYPLEKQEVLYRNLKRKNKRDLIVYLSKQDLVQPDQLKTFKHQFCTLEELKEKILKLARESLPQE